MDDLEAILCQDSGSEFIILSTMISLSIAHNLTPYEQNLFGNFLIAIGQNLSLISIRKDKCISEIKKCNENNSQSSIT